MRQFTDEEEAKLMDLAKWLNGFFCDGVVAWSLWTKENTNLAADKMYELQRLIDPTLPTIEDINEYWKENRTEMLPMDPPLDIFLDDGYWKNTGGGGGGIE